MAPANVSFDEFAVVRDMTIRVAENPDNLILDPPCDNINCWYSRGGLMRQHYCLIERLFQLNALLKAGSVKPDFSHMNPDCYVWLQYASGKSSEWKAVKVIRFGLVQEHDPKSKLKGDDCIGWWCSCPPQISFYKFFLKKFILQIQQIDHHF